MSTFNPFEAAPAPVAEAPEPAPAPVATAPAGAPVVVPSDADKIVVTLKGGAGFEAPWIVIHASSIAEADSLLSGDMANLMTKVSNAAAHFSGGQAPAGGAPAAAPTSAPPAGAQAPERPADVPADFVYRTGVSKKTGKAWKAWMPPTKGDPRSAIWVRD